MNPSTVTDERGQWTSASNAEADSLCPGRHQLCLQVPREETSSPDAEMGTRIHAYLAGEDVKLTDEEQEIAEVLKKRAAAIVDQWIAEMGFTQEQIDGAVEIKEVRIWFENRHSGKPDRVIVIGDHALIQDYKTGRNEVAENPSNLQLRDLAVLIASDWTYGFESVTVSVVPAFGQVGPLCKYGKSDLTTAEGLLIDRLEDVWTVGAKRIPGPAQCKYCRAKGICPEFKAASLPIVQGDTMPDKQAVETAIATMDSERLGAFLKLLRLADDVADTEIRRRLGDGINVPGWELAPGRESEKITDPNALASRWADAGGKIEQLMPAVTIAKGKLSKAISETFGAKGRERDDMLKVLLDGITETSTSNPVLKSV